MSPIVFGRAECGDPAITMRKEWLVGNGIGGYACGTVGGIATRRYHGLLVAALRPPVDRTLLVARLDAEIEYDGVRYGLATNAFADGTVDPHGYRHLERFELDGLIPVWTYAVADARLVQRVWMAYGRNTTYVTWTLERASVPLYLTLTALCTYRDHHHLGVARWDVDPGAMSTTAWSDDRGMAPGEPRKAEGGHGTTIDERRTGLVDGGFEIAAFRSAQPYRVVADRGTFEPIGDWYRAFRHGVEADRGFDSVSDLFAAGRFHALLAPGETLTVVCSTDAVAPHAGDDALAAERLRQAALLAAARDDDPPWIRRLHLAADAFVVRRDVGDRPGVVDRPALGGRDGAGNRPTASNRPAAADAPSPAAGYSVIAGYPWFADWGRDTMIALPGLLLATGRAEIAAEVLRTFARTVDRGLLPNRFPDRGEAPEYHTADATLWYFHAVDACARETGDVGLALDLYPVLADIVEWHEHGTRFGIGVDPADGLLRAGEAGVQLTWMDAKVGEHVITPRIGKAVELCALWHHALRVMADLALRRGDGGAAARYGRAADRAAASFRARFWYAEGGYLYDVVDGPEGDLLPGGRRADARLRPNQLVAVALPHDLVDADQARSVVDVCARKLWTSHGLRTLAPGEPGYVGLYAGGPAERDGAYHQGTAWAWLLGPFVRAHYRVYGDAALARSFLNGVALHLADAGLGSVSEICDGDAPFRPDGCPWQAWSVAEVLGAWRGCG